MKRKLNIGIIGAGTIGATLTRHFTRLGYDVVVANSRGPQRKPEWRATSNSPGTFEAPA